MISPSDRRRRGSANDVYVGSASVSSHGQRRTSDETLFSAPSMTRGSHSLDIIRDRFPDEVTLASDTNSTMSGLAGPGRVLGALFTKGGKLVSHAADIGAQRLGQGPDAHCVRLLTAIEDDHRVSKHGIRISAKGLSRADLELRDCNFIMHWATSRCEFCHTPFITLTDAWIRSRTAASAAADLVRCLS
jgi:hypothetical protein